MVKALEQPRELNGHKVNPANDKLTVLAHDEPGHGGACHDYSIEGFAFLIKNEEGQNEFCEATLLSFQDGPINEFGVNGITHEALIAILVDRLEGFQSGPYACRENALALTKLQEAQMWLQKRTRDRMARNVEGTHEV
jgi:hypothetical protein